MTLHRKGNVDKCGKGCPSLGRMLDIKHLAPSWTSIQSQACYEPCLLRIIVLHPARTTKYPSHEKHRSFDDRRWRAPRSSHSRLGANTRPTAVHQGSAAKVFREMQPVPCRERTGPILAILEELPVKMKPRLRITWTSALRVLPENNPGYFLGRPALIEWIGS